MPKHIAIRLREATRERIKDLCRKGTTYDEFINLVLDSWVKEK